MNLIGFMYRLSVHMTQSDVAEKIGCSKNAYSRYERGEREPNIDTLCRIADIFRISLDELVGRKNNSKFATQ